MSLPDKEKEPPFAVAAAESLFYLLCESIRERDEEMIRIFRAAMRDVVARLQKIFPKDAAAGDMLKLFSIVDLLENIPPERRHWLLTMFEAHESGDADLSLLAGHNPH